MDSSRPIRRRSRRMALIWALVVVCLVGATGRAVAGKLYFFDGEIRRISLNGANHEVVLGFPRAVGQLAIDLDNEKLYWAEVIADLEGVWRANLDGRGAERVIDEPARSVAVDSQNGKIYWGGNGVLKRADLDGSNVEILLEGTAFESLARDPIRGKIYWMYFSDPIRRANLDGSNVEDVVQDGILNHIALDPVAGKVYWIKLTGQIRRSNLDGTNVESVLDVMQGDPDGLAIDGPAGKLYWCDRTNQVSRANLDGSDPELLTVSPDSTFPQPRLATLAVFGTCGDGRLDKLEECDDGNVLDGDRCRPDCVLPFCGDGVIDAGEDCDDGNDITCDGCLPDCTVEIGWVCGDGIVNGFCDEVCDDGNLDHCDGCSPACTVETECAEDVLLVDVGGSTTYSTIQSAIDSAIPGQHDVVVGCGVFREHVTVRSGVDLRGAHPSCAVIEGDEGVTVRVTVDEPTTIEGFTIRNGDPKIGGEGGAITITGNVIEDLSENPGDGIRLEVPFFDASAVGAPVIRGNVIRRNANGVRLIDTDAADVTRNVIHHNSGRGLSLESAEGVTRIESNLIAHNVNTSSGGGMFISASRAEIFNNTVVYNEADDGGGIYIWLSEVLLISNVVAWNTANDSGGVRGAGLPLTRWNDVFGNTPDDWWPSDLTGIDGNISVDPGFLDMRLTSFAGFQPRSSSPLIDAGSLAPFIDADLRGVTRVIDGDGDGTAVTDIGARENEGVTGVTLADDGVSWDAGKPGVPTTFDVFRGDLRTLRESGSYTQDPAIVDGARHFCGLPEPLLLDVDTPQPGQGLFYLVAIRGETGGTLGFDSSLLERPRGIGTPNCGLEPTSEMSLLFTVSEAISGTAPGLGSGAEQAHAARRIREGMLKDRGD